MVPQWDFLELLAAAAEKEPTFRLLRSTEVLGPIIRTGTRKDRVIGVSYRGADGQVREMHAVLTVACDGRSSTLRSAMDLRPRSFGAPMDVWWFRLPRDADDPHGLAGVLGAGAAQIVIDRGDYYQCAYVIPKGGDAQLRAQGIEALHRGVVALVPWLAGHISALTSFDEVKLLDVQLNRLRRWYTDGLLLIGDAAHAMSPVGGVGINLAVADAVAAARILAGPLRAGAVPTRQLARVQARRWVPAALIQAVQRLIHSRVIAVAVASRGTAKTAAAGEDRGTVSAAAHRGRIRDRGGPVSRTRAGVCPTLTGRPSGHARHEWTPGMSAVDDVRMVLRAHRGLRRVIQGRVRDPVDRDGAGAVHLERRLLRNPFPPIADYAFLSDCETTCLISSAGSVEWLCVPRPDSPSVFGAILDRGAGHFRLAPYGVTVPAARRYLPGSLILETTWQTHTGWMIVRDALVMGPWHDIEARSRTHRRTPMDWDAEHILLRTVRCVSGIVELVMNCEPAFDYHRIPATWEYSAARRTARRSPGPGKDPDAHPTLRLTTNLRLGLEGHEARARTRLTEGDNVFVALSWSKHPAPQTYEEAADKMWKTSECMAAVDQHRRLPRSSVALIPAAQRTDPQGPDVLADRCTAGGEHDVTAGNASGRTKLGLPLRLGARLDIRAVGPVHAGPGSRGRRLLRVHRRRVRRQQR